jgi:ABC-type sugar transport system permease subunit
MQTTAKRDLPQTSYGEPPSPLKGIQSLIIPASIIANLVVMVSCIFVAILVIGLEVEEFGNLGKPVQVFVGLITLIPAVLAAYSAYALIQKKPSGRFAAIVIQYIGAVLSIVFMLHLWGFFLSFEGVVDGIMENGALTLGLAFAYGLWWLAGRLEEENLWRERLEMVAVGVGMLTLIIILFVSGILQAASDVLGKYDELDTWAATLAAIGFSFLAYHMLHLSDYFGETPEQRVAWQGWLMLSPNIIGFLIFFAGPLLLSFYLSFTDSTLGQTPKVNGIDNYLEILALEFKWQGDNANAQDALSFGYSELTTINIFGNDLIIGAKDTLFWQSLRNTLVFCILLVPLSIIPALGLSLILNSKLPGVNFFRALYFIPSIAAVVGTALIWRWLYDPTIGYFNYIIGEIVNFLNSTLGFNLSDPNIQWLTGPGVVLFSIVFLASWQAVGFNTVLFLAGLQGIPNTLYEAATVDGANRWQQFRNVTLPMLAPTTFFVSITTIVTGLQVFNEPFALFPARPIPVQATTSVFYLYNRGFNRFEFGYASSVAWLLFIIIFAVTLVQFRLQRSDAYGS